MIRKFRMEDLERVMELWLNTNIQAYDFIVKDDWISNFDMLKTILPKTELYVYEIQIQYIPVKR
ncbi:MAG: hypothetical protein ACERKN_11225 [Velocimicrobium sp.]